MLYIFSKILGSLHPLQKEGFIRLVLRLFKFTGGLSLYLTLNFTLVLQTGILRTVLQAFLKAGSEPQLEALREFLLLAMVSNFDFVLIVRLLKSVQQLHSRSPNNCTPSIAALGLLIEMKSSCNKCFSRVHIDEALDGANYVRKG